ncbi:MAG: hypothetical protein E7270_08060 [Lachnospiraceae bacterium]|nr:hypothetical protein [Lachnospiraceae bacterium]
MLSRLLLSHVKNYKLKSLVEELELEWDYSYRTIDAARLVAKMYLIYVATAYVDYVRKSVTKYILFVRKSVDK